MCIDRLSPPFLNHICLPCLFPFYLVTSPFLFPFTYVFLQSLLSCMFIFISSFLLTVSHSQVLPSMVFFVIFSCKECAFFFDWKACLIWIPPTLPEGSTLTIKLHLVLLLAVVLNNVGRKTYDTHLCKPEIKVKKGYILGFCILCLC